MRIVSLVPSLTETLCRLGLQSQIVGCTQFCTHPASLRHTAISVGGTKDASFEAIASLRPTHVVVNDEENVAPLIERLKDARLSHGWRVVDTYPVTVEDAIAMVGALGAWFGVESAAREWTLEAREELVLCRAEAARRGAIRYGYFIWREPWMVAGNQTYVSEMLGCAGGLNLIETSRRAQDRYPALPPEDPRLREADVLLFSSEPYPFKKRHMDEFLDTSGLTVAVRKIDGQRVSWFGTMTLDGLRYLRSYFDEAEP